MPSGNSSGARRFVAAAPDTHGKSSRDRWRRVPRAVAAVLIHLGRTETELEVVMPGGSLQLRQTPRGSLLQSGPARRVFRAVVDLADLEQA